MITQTYQIDMIPGGDPAVIHVSQYDNAGRTLAFELYNGGVEYTVPTGATVSLSGTKPDGTGFLYSMTVDGSTASIDIPQQVAIVAGDVAAELRITSDSGIIGSANFIIRVEKAALDDETAISETDLPAFEAMVETATAAATSAAQSATDAETALAATEALFPSGGTSGQFLKKTASATQWADIDALPTGGTSGQVLTKQSATDGDADWETPAYVPTSGTSGQVLTKTASGYQWQTTTGGVTNLAVTATYSSGAWTADHTFSEIEANIAAGGVPYLIHSSSNSIYRLALYSAGDYVTFAMTTSGGEINNIKITSGDVVSYTLSYATTRRTITLSAAGWSGNVYTISDAYILNPSSCDVTVTMPDQTTEALMEAAIAEFAGYDLYPFNHVTGALSIYARGSVPTSDITLILIISKR